MLGKAAVAMWWDIAPEMKAEFEDWHSHEHMPERVAIPGFLRGSRWIALSGEPSYFVMYEAADLATLTGGAYLERLNNPTPWSRKMMPHHLNVVRSLCRVRASFGRGVAHAVATVRLDAALAADALAPLPQHKGVTGAHLLESQPMGGIAPTVEQQIRGRRDVQAHWVAIIGGYDAEAVGAAARTLAAGATPQIFRLSYSLARGDPA
jgi:hypothetical protein